MTNPTHPGTRIKAIRQSRGLTITALALLAGIDRTYLGRVESGERAQGMAFEIACKVADALGVSVEALRSDKGE